MVGKEDVLDKEDVWKVIYEVGKTNLVAPLDLKKEVDYFFKDVDVELTDST